MIIGVPTETIEGENRVGLSPNSCQELIQLGASVLITKDAGKNCNFADDDYVAVGCKVVDNNKSLYETAESIVKIKEPKGDEINWLQEGQSIFSFLHLASNPELFNTLLKKKICAFAYESVFDDNRVYPTLVAMGKIAAVLAVNLGAEYLLHHKGGKGKLLFSPDGLSKGGNVVVLGSGNVGITAARFAAMMGAETYVLDIKQSSLDKLPALDNIHKVLLKEEILCTLLKQADLLIGSVLLPDKAPPKVIKNEHLTLLEPGTVLVDVAIDQGGCFESSVVTSHAKPAKYTNGLVHIAVPNLPGSVPLTSVTALENVVTPWLKELFSASSFASCLSNSSLLTRGINTYAGESTNSSLSQQYNVPYCDPATLFSH